mgnify:CR=1 FL=1
MTKNIGHVNGLPVASDLLGLAAVYQPRHLQCLSLSLFLSVSVSVSVCLCHVHHIHNTGEHIN